MNRSLTQVLWPLLAVVFVIQSCSNGSSGSGSSGDDEPAEVPPEAPVVVDDGDNEGENEGDNEQVGFVTAPGVTACSTEDINARVDFDMRDYYIFYDQVPQLNLAEFDSPESLIRALRVDPDIYSFVTDDETRAQLVEEGMAEGRGFWFQPAGDGAVRFREILSGSPADEAGLLRGDELIELNGRPIGEISRDELREELTDADASVSMQVRTSDEGELRGLLTASDRGATHSL